MVLWLDVILPSGQKLYTLKTTYYIYLKQCVNSYIAILIQGKKKALNSHTLHDAAINLQLHKNTHWHPLLTIA